MPRLAELDRSRPRWGRAALLGASLLAACDTLPGEVVGAYRVTMHLEENTCGTGALRYPDGMRYAVELRTDDVRAFWRLPRQPPFAGSYRDGRFEFQYSQTLELGMADAGTLGCGVLQEERLHGAVTLDDAGTLAMGDGGALRGEHLFSFRPDPSGRCQDQRGPLREFERLPCMTRYRLEGSTRSAF